MKRIVFVISFLAIWGMEFAKGQTFTQVCKIKKAALEVYDEYTRTVSNLHTGDEYKKDDFVRLFCDDFLVCGEKLIDNDILPALPGLQDGENGQSQGLSPEEYIDRMAKYVKIFSSSYSDLDLSFPEKNGSGEWEIRVGFKKVVNFETQAELHYPKHEFFYVMTIVMNENFEQAKIRRMEVLNSIGPFFILENRPEFQWKYGGLPIEDWDGETNNRIFESKEYDVNEIEWKDPGYFQSMTMTTLPEDRHFYDLQQRKRDIFGVGLNYMPYGFGNKIDKRFTGMVKYSNALALSLFYGLQIGHSKSDKSTWFFNAGLDMNRYYHKFYGTDYTEYEAIDSDNDPYMRKIWISNLEERINSISVSVPLSFSYLLKLVSTQEKTIFLSLELGAFFEYTFWSGNTYSINADYHGFYDYYGGVEFDHYYDYGTFGQNGTQTLAKVKDLRYDYGVSGNVGCWLALDRRNMLKICIGYKHGFNTPLTYKNNVVISENKQSYQSLLPSTKQGLRNLFLGISYVRAITLKK